MIDTYTVGEAVPLAAQFVDRSGASLTGISASVTVEIFRKSDSYFYDFNDGTFKNAGWTTRQGALSEVSSSNAAGWYVRADVSTTAWSTGAYIVTYRDSSGSAGNGVQIEAFRLTLAATTLFSGTASAGAAASITLTGGPATDDLIKRQDVAIVGGTGAGQVRTILAYNGTTKVATVGPAWTTTPDSTSMWVVTSRYNPIFLDTGLAQAGASSSLTLASTSSSTNDLYVGLTLVVMSGTGAGQARIVSAYNGSTKVATVATAWATTPDSTSAYVLLPVGRAITVSNLDKTGYGLAAGAVDATAIADNAITAAKVASNAITSDKIATDAIGVAQVAADAVTKIQTGLATSTALSTAQADLTAIKGAGFVGGTDDLHSAHTLLAAAATASALSTVAANVATIVGYGAPPSAASNASAVWATAVPGAFTSGQAGYVLGTNLDALVSSRLATSGYTAPPSAVTISAAVVDQALSGHTTAGTVGEALSRVDVVVSTRLASADYTAPPSAAAIALQVDTTLSGTHGAGGWITATTVGLSAGALTASSIGVGYVAAVQSGLATATNVSDAQTAINAHTDGAVSGLAAEATLSAGITAILTDVGAVPAAVWATAGRTLSNGAIAAATFASGAIDATAFAQGAADKVWGTAARTLTAFTGAPLTSVVQGVWGEALPGSYGAGTAGAKLGTPAAVTIADDGISAAAVSAAAVAKIQSGLALGATLNSLMGAGFDGTTDSLHALRARGDSAWTTANVDSLATTAQLDAHALAIKGASFDTNTDSLHALRVLTATLPTAAQIWAYDISGNVSLTQAGGALYGLKVLGFNRMEETAGNPGTLLVYADDGVTLRFSFTLRDATGGAVTASTGEPARRSAVA